MNGDSGIPDGGKTDAGALDAGTDAGATGAPCSTPAQCLGSNPTCETMLGGVTAPGGYCTGACILDQDCPGGFCVTTGGPICLESCDIANPCQPHNPNNRCFFFDATHDACLPAGFSSCDPTVTNSCANNLCKRVGPDNVGVCLTACTYGGTCAADAQGNPLQCLFVNAKTDVTGSATQDVALGLACIPPGLGSAIGASCKYVDDCAAGAECNFYMAGGKGKVCAKLCRKGLTDCSGTGGTCQDAFLLTMSGDWQAGAIGLCL
jgi:hypothetical protein